MDKILVEYNSPNGLFFQHRLLNRNYSIRSASHIQYEFFYLLKGRVDVMINGTHFDVSAGEIVVIEEGVFHSMTMKEGEEDTELMVFEFVSSNLPGFMTLDFLRSGLENPVWVSKIPKDLVEKNKLGDYYKRINAYVKNKKSEEKDAFIVAEIIKLVATLKKLMENEMKFHQLDKNENSGQSLVERCIYYINANMSKKITIEDIAKNCYCSKSYIQHIFKKQMGIAISDYINAQKMTIARSMLAGNISPLEVSMKLGYEYYTTFSVKFKAYYGITPKNVTKYNIVENWNVEQEEDFTKTRKSNGKKKKADDDT